MSITFVCSCGKRLRAREEMAARRSVCPRCGAPVGIPALQPTHPGTSLGPMSPAERLRARRPTPPELPAARPKAVVPATAALPEPEPSPRPPLDANAVRLVLGRDSLRRPLETHWFECF